MVYRICLWWCGGWLIIVLTTLEDFLFTYHKWWLSIAMFPITRGYVPKWWSCDVIVGCFREYDDEPIHLVHLVRNSTKPL